MTPTSAVLADMSELRAQLHRQGSPHSPLFRVDPTRVMLDIAFDWAMILIAVSAVVTIGLSVFPLAILLIANRQRALGNILHDAGHRNLWRDRRRNDLVARVLVAPLLFASLSSYRASHFRHHMALGHQHQDPDFLPTPERMPSHWLQSYMTHVFCWKAWLGSFAGHLLNGDVGWASKMYIVAWWGGALWLLWSVADMHWALTFMVLWLMARATVFHLITTLREMCDHHGLQPGGVFSYTRDMACQGLWRRLIHPRNNGYHLTHHLLPSVPYYRLPQAHQLLKSQPLFRQRSTICGAYFSGPDAVVRAWQTGGSV